MEHCCVSLLDSEKIMSLLRKAVFFLFALLVVLVPVTVYAQDIKLATFQESAQILVDKARSQNVTASITLQTTSNQEFRVPNEIEQKILDNPRILSVVLTNEESCVLGVVDKSCIIVNISRDPEDKGIIAIQNSSKTVANTVINDLNKLFDTNAEFNSAFVNVDDTTNKSLETSGAVSGRGTISVSYTMDNQDTSSMYEKMSAILLAKPIRDSGGFYSTAQELSKIDNSKMTVSLIPQKSRSSILYQIKVSMDYPNYAGSLNQINPLELLKTQKLERSLYFSSAFYPLNSIIQVAVISKEPISVDSVKGNVIPTEVKDGVMIPNDITNAGWVFDSSTGEKIEANYIFGKKQSINANEIGFSIIGGNQTGKMTPIKPETQFDQSFIVLIVIVIAAAGAIMFYLKGYKK